MKTAFELNFWNSYNLFVSSLSRLKNWSYAEHVLAHRMSFETYKPYAGEDCILLHEYVKLTMEKEKWSRLSWIWVVILPWVSLLNKISKFQAEMKDSLLSFISSSLGCIESTYEWKLLLLMDNTSTTYWNVILNNTARDLFF